MKNDEAGDHKRSCDNEMGIRFVEQRTIRSLEGDTKILSSKNNVSEKDTTMGPLAERLSLSSDNVDAVDKASRNKAEVIVRSNKVRADVRPYSFEVNPESRVNDSKTRNGKRRSTMELNATTTVKTDADGVPTISFSFLRADENFHENDDEIVILEVDTSDQTNSSGNQLYDLPKSASLENNQSPLERTGHDKEINSGEPSLPIIRQDLYDVPKSTRKDVSSNDLQEKEMPICNPAQENCKSTNMLVSFEKNKNQQRDQMKRSTRSLKSGRRSYGASDSDGYDAGIASMSGSYSDPECPNEAALSESGDSNRSKRLKLQKRRLGKAWGRMRSWLREEKTRIGQVVNRHAKLQAVGALSPEVVPKKRGKKR